MVSCVRVGSSCRSTTLTSSCRAPGRVVQDNQTVRKLPEFRVKWCEERAVGNSGRLGLVWLRVGPEGAPGCSICARIEPGNPASGRDGGGHGLDAEDVEGAT